MQGYISCLRVASDQLCMLLAYVPLWSLQKLLSCGAAKFRTAMGRNKAALPRNFWQRIAEYLQESFLDISVEDSWDISVYVNKLFCRVPTV